MSPRCDSPGKEVWASHRNETPKLEGANATSCGVLSVLAVEQAPPAISESLALPVQVMVLSQTANVSGWRLRRVWWTSKKSLRALRLNHDQSVGHDRTAPSREDH